MDGSIRNNEDLLMNYYLFREAERTVYEDFCPYHYILRLGSATTNQISENKLKDPIKVLRILLQETQGYSQQYEAVRRRYVRALCNIATMLTGGQTETNILYRKEMRCALRRELPEILSKKHYGIRLKAIALCAAVWPGFYAGIHWMYSRIKGLDKTRNLKRVR